MATKRKRPVTPKPSPDNGNRTATHAEPVEESAEDAALREAREWVAWLLPPHDFGPWPEGFTVSREQIYDEDGR